jgi:hypothetical protein
MLLICKEIQVFGQSIARRKKKLRTRETIGCVMISKTGELFRRIIQFE